MSGLITAYGKLHQGLFRRLRHLDGLPPLLMRLYLAPVMIAVGLHKFRNWDDMVTWFGNPDWGLGLPVPTLMVALAASAELFGGFALLLGLAVRWFAIAPGDPDTSTAKVLAMVGIPAAERSLENSVEVGQRVSAARSLLREHGDYDWLTEKGNFVVLNNGIEFAATYFIMLLSLFFSGGGRYVSLDYWLARRTGAVAID